MPKINHLSTPKISPEIPVPQVTATSIQEKARIRGLIAKMEISVIKKYCGIAALLNRLHLMSTMQYCRNGDNKTPC